MPLAIPYRSLHHQHVKPSLSQIPVVIKECFSRLLDPSNAVSACHLAFFARSMRAECGRSIGTVFAQVIAVTDAGHNLDLQGNEAGSKGIGDHSGITL